MGQMCTGSLPVRITPRDFDTAGCYLVSMMNKKSLATPSSQQSPVLSLGPMQMVVMDYVSHRGVTPPDTVQQIEAVLYKLHCRGYVFGDLRTQNVLFDEDGKVKFIDFDLSGRYDMNVRDNSLPTDFQKRIDSFDPT